MSTICSVGVLVCWCVGVCFVGVMRGLGKEREARSHGTESINIRGPSEPSSSRLRITLTLQPETITDLWRYVPDSIAAMATLAFSEDVLLVPTVAAGRETLSSRRRLEILCSCSKGALRCSVLFI